MTTEDTTKATATPQGAAILSPPSDENIDSRLELIDQLKTFLVTAPDGQQETVKQHPLATTGEHLSCVKWNDAFYISGTDIVRCLVFRFLAFGRPVQNAKKFEEGIFSDLRNLKPGSDAILEEPKSDFLDLLFKNNCIRTQKKQKVFFWYSVPHDRLFLDALERDLKREKMGAEPTSVAVAYPAVHISLNTTQAMFDEFRKVMVDELNLDVLYQQQQQQLCGGSTSDHKSCSGDEISDSYSLSTISPERSGTSGNTILGLSTAAAVTRELVNGHHVPSARDHQKPITTSTSTSSTVFGQFSLFEGSPTYKQRRRRANSFVQVKQESAYNNEGALTNYNNTRLRMEINNNNNNNNKTWNSSSGSSSAENTTDDEGSATTKETSTEKHFNCPLSTCGKYFKRLEHMKRHLRTHTMERPYLCDLCGKRFSRSDNLAQHKKTHERTRRGGGGYSSSSGSNGSSGSPSAGSSSSGGHGHYGSRSSNDNGGHGDEGRDGSRGSDHWPSILRRSSSVSTTRRRSSAYHAESTTGTRRKLNSNTSRLCRRAMNYQQKKRSHAAVSRPLSVIRIMITKEEESEEEDEQVEEVEQEQEQEQEQEEDQDEEVYNNTLTTPTWPTSNTNNMLLLQQQLPELSISTTSTSASSSCEASPVFCTPVTRFAPIIKIEDTTTQEEQDVFYYEEQGQHYDGCNAEEMMMEEQEELPYCWESQQQENSTVDYQQQQQQQSQFDWQQTPSYTINDLIIHHFQQPTNDYHYLHSNNNQYDYYYNESNSSSCLTSPTMYHLPLFNNSSATTAASSPVFANTSVASLVVDELYTNMIPPSANDFLVLN